MKKERKLNLVLKKVCVSKLNAMTGKGGVSSVDFLCQISVDACPDSELCTVPGVNCKTFITASDSVERC